MTANVNALCTLNASFGHLLVAAYMRLGKTSVLAEKYLYPQAKQGNRNQ
jgi:hypothetical protein